MEILDVAVGLIFLYLLLALVCTAINELIASALNLRGKKLLVGITNLFRTSRQSKESLQGGLSITEEDIYGHPLVRSLYGDRWPSYIPASHFADGLLDTLLPVNATESRTVASIEAQVRQLDNDSLRRTLLVLIEKSGGDRQPLQENIEDWFNKAMERVSGWYKRQAQWITLALALTLAISTNVDTVSFASQLSTDSTLRQLLVEQARLYANSNVPAGPIARDSARGPGVQDTSIVRLQEKGSARIDDLEKLGLAIGWKRETFPGSLDATKVLGLLLTAFAISLGAPFWFDLLNKVMNMRASGDVPNH